MKQSISLEKQLSKFFAGIYIAIFGVIAMLISISIINYRKENQGFFSEKVSEYAQELEQAIDEINSVISYIYLENTAFSKIPYESEELELFKLSYQLLSDIELLMNTNQGIEGVFIYYNDCEDVVYQMADSITTSEKRELFTNIESILDPTLNIRGYVIQEVGSVQYYTIYFIRDGAAVLGLINIESLLEDIEELNEWNGNVKGILADNEITVSSGEYSEFDTISFDVIEDGYSKVEGVEIYLQTVDNTGLQVFAAVPFSIWNKLSQQQMIILCLLIFSIYPAIKVYDILRRQIMHPLAELVNVMTRVQQGDWDVEFELPTNFEEITSVKKALVVMVKEIETLKIEAYEEKNRKQYAELQYLQLQLSPHFYINCLKLIQAKIQMGYMDEVENFLIQLSAHFRYLMKQATRMVRVSDEMKFVHNYLGLAKDMVTDNIVTCIYVDHEAREKEIPILSIQTFIENSVKYARKNSSQILTLDIQVKYMKVGEGEFVNIIIKDDGVGYSDCLLESLNGTGENEEVGIGVSNLKKRIELTYEKDYSWYFYNQNGAISELVLPVNE